MLCTVHRLNIYNRLKSFKISINIKMMIFFHILTLLKNIGQDILLQGQHLNYLLKKRAGFYKLREILCVFLFNKTF